MIVPQWYLVLRGNNFVVKKVVVRDPISPNLLMMRMNSLNIEPIESQ